jgi:hypothetical protein
VSVAIEIDGTQNRLPWEMDGRMEM